MRGMTGEAIAGHGHEDGGACLNCGTTRVGDYCHACGQSGHIHRSMSAIGHDLAHGVFHFEGRALRTLPMLATRPGELTRRYIAGERARFVSPMALFLFIVFVLFTLLSILGAHLEAPALDGATAQQARIQMEQSLARNAAQTSTLATQRAAATDPAEIARLDGKLRELAAETRATQLAMTTADPSGWRKLGELKTGWKRLDKGLAKAVENPNLILYKLQSNAYKFAWALIPLSLPFMWLMFPFSRRFGMYDHAVFVTYSLCFMLLLVLAVSLFAQLPVGSGLYGLVITVAIIAAPIHMYKQLRGAYGCGRIGAFLRTLLLFVISTWVITVFTLLLVGLGLVG
ncbi:DUF3667 domain-containing protein [Sphingomonas jinjuensis]|nr:DUF3667 domain-containing protein [Sphingomonas jinjuensis]